MTFDFTWMGVGGSDEPTGNAPAWSSQTRADARNDITR